MASQKVSIRYLIDVAIGNPEPGIVNFNALYTVLQAISEKLALQDERIEIDSSFCPIAGSILESKSNVSSERLMDHQVFDFTSEMVEEKILDRVKPTKDTGKSKPESECRKTTPRSGQYEESETPQQNDDRKVVFEAEEEATCTLSGRKPKDDRLAAYRSELRQHIDALNARLGKIENTFVASAEAGQNVECLRAVIHQMQDKFSSLESAVYDLRDMRAIQEQDLSACRKKLEQDKILAVVDGLKSELGELRNIIGLNFVKGNKPLKMPSVVAPGDSANETSIDSSKLKAQLLEMRSNICSLIDRITNMENTLAHGKMSSSVITMHKFDQEMSGVRQFVENAAGDLGTLKTEHDAQKNLIGELTAKLDELTKTKIDKEEIDELLSEKADYTMLQRKVSVENMDADRRKLEKQISEITDCFVLNEERVQRQISDIKKFLGDQSLDEMLYDFKIKVDKDIQVVRDAIKRLAEMKPDVDSSVTRLRDLTCLSCDQDVVMRAVELNNLSKFGDAYVSRSISPMVALELGKLREAGKVGPMDVSDTICEMARNFRHSGGMHTIITNKDRVTKGKSHRHK